LRHAALVELEPGMLETEIREIRAAAGGDQHVLELAAVRAAGAILPGEANGIAGRFRGLDVDLELEPHALLQLLPDVALQLGIGQRADRRGAVEKRDVRAEAVK